MGAATGLFAEGAAAVMAEVTLSFGFVFAMFTFAMPDDVLALAVAAMKDLDDHARSSPVEAKQQPLVDHYHTCSSGGVSPGW